MNSVLVNLSWRQSHRLDKGDTFGQSTAATAGTGNEAWQKIGTADASWVINSKSFASFKYTHFENPTQGRPDYVSDVAPTLTPGTKLDLANLDKIGQFSVPSPLASTASGADAFNAFIAPLVQKYGYNLNGVRRAAARSGMACSSTRTTSSATAGQFAYNITLGTKLRHDLHAGLQWYTDSENLKRSSNGWGAITVPGGRLASAGVGGVNAYYQATYLQQTTGAVPAIHSEYKSVNVEVNDRSREQLVVQCRLPGQQGHALRPGPARGCVDALRLRIGPGQQVQDVHHPVRAR